MSVWTGNGFTALEKGTHAAMLCAARLCKFILMSIKVSSSTTRFGFCVCFYYEFVGATEPVKFLLAVRITFAFD